MPGTVSRRRYDTKHVAFELGLPRDDTAAIMWKPGQFFADQTLDALCDLTSYFGWDIFVEFDLLAQRFATLVLGQEADIPCRHNRRQRALIFLLSRIIRYLVLKHLGQGLGDFLFRRQVIAVENDSVRDPRLNRSPSQCLQLMRAQFAGTGRCFFLAGFAHFSAPFAPVLKPRIIAAR
ncbi:hypothetical protein [Paraburkholderia aspalathi]|uniref:hypothetical protein n=1 Tax=Paraburkholderia aspalathi TaxID=1324617 RepID=UPI00190CDCBD|nr:hypothetical protein [Paraburkholderia aspalathi]